MLNILNLSEEADILEYRKIYDVINNNDPFFLFDYLFFFGKKNEKLISFVYYDSHSDKYILMPGYISRIIISNTYTKFHYFSSPYGYTGPLISKDISSKSVEQFWEEMTKWYSENNVVTEFIRFNLFQNYINYDSTLHRTMLNIRGRIINEELQWKSFDSKVRKNVNKALREGLICNIFHKNIPDNEIEYFYNVYIKTMDRTNASRNFYYKLSDFKYFIKNNLENTAICNIYLQSKVISSELVLVSNNAIYSFLGGTDENYFDKRPNDLLKFELINWARRNNKDFYILGGGYGYEDGIFKYKKSFFPNDVVTFYTGRKIVNIEKYLEFAKLNNDYRISKLLNPLSIEDDSFFPIFNKQD